MSMFYCNQCDSLCDANDGCTEDPANKFELICVDCMIELEDEPLPNSQERGGGDVVPLAGDE